MLYHALLIALLSLATASTSVSYGPRPFFLIDELRPSELKASLQGCMSQTPRTSLFSIGHRGACMQFPEHTKESYVAAARMGAGILECDVTFTRDLELVCRHSQCDLHTTTNILVTDLASKCSEPFTPAEGDKPASAKCCTSDITLAEFKTLTGKMDGADTSATTVEEYLQGTASWRTDLYASSGAVGTLLTHAESIELFRDLGSLYTPELKEPSVEMPFMGFTQQQYAQKLIDEYKKAGVSAEEVWAQSFNLDDVKYWIEYEPRFGSQAVFLDDRYNDETFNLTNPSSYSPSMPELYDMGVRIVAPPMWFLLTTDESNKLVRSTYARAAYDSGLEIITWTLERSGAPPSGWYTQTFKDAIKTDGDILEILHVLAKEVKILGIFTDWPATVTFFANCFGL